MAFYQGALPAGYAWAHLGTTRLRFRWQSVIQVVFLGGLSLFLPITIAADLRVPVSGGLAPAIWLCKVLVVSAGLPFCVIATMTPTLGKQPSIWAVLARCEADLGELAADSRWQAPGHRPGARPWTDDFSDLASHLVLGGRRFAAAAAAPRGGQDSSSLILRTRSVVLSPSRRGQIATVPP
jgi:hypothetical protein